MPDAPTRLCVNGHTTTGRGECRLCYAARDAVRGTRGERGYDQAWQRLRDRHATDNPLCAECARHGRVEAMSDVDHVRPFTTFSDPLRLDPLNLQSLCKRCHRDKSARDWASTRSSSTRAGMGGCRNVAAPSRPKPHGSSSARDRTTFRRSTGGVQGAIPGAPRDDDGPTLA
jgi:5-methylcytosine-specific restriction protein A